MKKILSILGAMSLTFTSTSAVVACGDQSNLAVSKVDLKDLDLKTTIGIGQNDNEDDIFAAFLVINQAIFAEDLTQNQVELSNFKTPGLGATKGTLTITMKPGIRSKYIGAIDITTELKIDLSSLNLKTVIIGSQGISEVGAFNAFSKTNQAIFAENLSFEYFELTNFQTIEIRKNGTLTVTANNKNNKYTGSIDLKFVHVLDATTLATTILRLSAMKLTNFQVTTGSSYKGENSAFAQITTEFTTLMGQYYQLGSNVLAISLVGASEKPEGDELNQKGLVWSREILSWILLKISHLDGSAPQYLGVWNIPNITITII